MDLDDAYANAAYIPDADGFIAMWEKAAATFRASGLCEIDLQYGESERQRIDLFHPPRLAKGLVVFVHGGYWLRFDKSYWSHLAAGPLANGWAVAMPSYDLCPDVRITDIGNQVAQAIGFAAARVPGPIRLVGHSAGGQLVARMSQERSGALWQERVEKIVSISPVADLAPLMRTSMNKELCLTEEEVARESPVHLAPPSIPVTVWVGADERPVFLEQSRALSNAWQCREVIVPDRHHFDIIAGMSDPQSRSHAKFWARKPFLPFKQAFVSNSVQVGHSFAAMVSVMWTRKNTVPMVGQIVTHDSCKMITVHKK